MRPPILFFFTAEELIELKLYDLDPSQLATINAAVFDLIRNSATIKDELKVKIRDVYAQINPPVVPGELSTGATDTKV